MCILSAPAPPAPGKAAARVASQGAGRLYAVDEALAGRPRRECGSVIATDRVALRRGHVQVWLVGQHGEDYESAGEASRRHCHRRLLLS